MRDVVKPSSHRAVDGMLAATSGAVLFALVSLGLVWLTASVHLEESWRSVVLVAGNVSVWMCLGPCGLSMVYFYLRGFQLIRREEQRGYSTGPHAEGPLFVVDPRTGLVLRRPEDPPLKTRQEVKLARAQASELFVLRADRDDRAGEG